MQTARNIISPFELALGDVGAFPTLGRARALFVGVDGEIETLTLLRDGVEAELSKIGFRRDRRRFNPHITVARIRDRVSRPDRRAVVEAARSANHAKVAFRVAAFSLFQSTLTPEGAIYNPLATVRLSSGS